MNTFKMRYIISNPQIKCIFSEMNKRFKKTQKIHKNVENILWSIYNKAAYNDII